MKHQVVSVKLLISWGEWVSIVSLESEVNWKAVWARDPQAGPLGQSASRPIGWWLA